MNPHMHTCACGDYFVCRQEPDHCIVPNPYTCPNCEQQDRDTYFEQLAARLRKDTTDEPQQSHR